MVRIAVDTDGNAWAVNNADEIHHWDGGWRKMPGLAKDVGAGAAGVWAIGINPTPGGYGIYRWQGNDWDGVGGGAVRVGVGKDVVVANDEGYLFAWID